ncbi:MAG: alpha-glucosidase C-terminal domain-containing protein [Anaerolineaceae bacterium]|nr:alpha-glucosidase C-terminal domain-containing protein [Anaerolineaceae bacterium]
MFKTYKALIRLRDQYLVLSLGDFQTLRIDDPNQIFVYRRSHAGQTLIIALNNTRQAQPVELELQSSIRPVDMIS